MRHADELIGQTIGGRYRIISKLGEGGMGVAYRAWYEQGGVLVVIKVPHRMFFADPKFAQRFYREIQVLQGLFHSHVVPILDVGVHQGVPFFAMPLLPGGSLSDRRLRDGQGKPKPNPAARLHCWLPAVADALDYVHSQGVVHRDVKPANIFFDAFWGAYLGDFGIAKIVEESDAFDTEHTLTATHMLIGTHLYNSPEQFMPKAAIDGRSDQYSLAVTVYEMLAGVRPFTGANNLAVEVLTYPVPPITSHRRDLPKSLVEAVHKGLAKNSAERFPTCRDFSTAVLRDVPTMKDEPGVARLLCPKCRQILKLPAEVAGKKCKCPKCWSRMEAADDLGALLLAGEAPAGPRRRRPSSTLSDVFGEPWPDKPNVDVDEQALEASGLVSSTPPIEIAELNFPVRPKPTPKQVTVSQRRGPSTFLLAFLPLWLTTPYGYALIPVCLRWITEEDLFFYYVDPDKYPLFSYGELFVLFWAPVIAAGTVLANFVWSLPAPPRRWYWVMASCVLGVLCYSPFLWLLFGWQATKGARLFGAAIVTLGFAAWFILATTLVAYVTLWPRVPTRLKNLLGRPTRYEGCLLLVSLGSVAVLYGTNLLLSEPVPQTSPECSLERKRSPEVADPLRTVCHAAPGQAGGHAAGREGRHNIRLEQRLGDRDSRNDQSLIQVAAPV